MKYTAIVDQQRLEIELEKSGAHGLEARIGGRLYSVESKEVEPGVYWVNWNNRSLEITVTPGAEGYTVSIDRHRIAVEVLDARTALKKAAQHGHDGLVELRAPMPGKVVKLLVAEGAEVAANQGILVMEAMKMQNEIKSPKKGIVKKLTAAEGVAVNSGDVLATVE